MLFKWFVIQFIGCLTDMLCHHKVITTINQGVHITYFSVTDGLNNKLLFPHSGRGLNNELLVQYSGHGLNNELLQGI